MKLEELKEVNCFDNQIIESKLTIEKALINIEFFAKRLLKAFNYYNQCDCNSYEAQLAIGDMRDNINSYVQAFIDITMVVLDVGVCDSLRHIIREYTSTYLDLNYETAKWLDFCQRRNDLIHRYYSYDFMNEELLSALTTYEEGVMGLVNHIRRKCIEANKLTSVIIKEG